MNASFDQPFIRATSALRAYHANAAAAARWMHHSWTMTLLDIDAAQFERWKGVLARASRTAVERASLALCESAGVHAPRIDALSQPALRVRPGSAQPNPALLDACPAAIGLQVLRMRALSFRREEALRLIDRRTRAQLSEWTGCGTDHLCRDAHLAEAPDIARLSMHARIPPLAGLDEEALAVEGFTLVRRDLQTDAPCPLLRCALPRVLNEPEWLARVPQNIDSSGSARLFARLPELLPEWTWLFG